MVENVILKDPYEIENTEENAYDHNTYAIVSTVGYLLGIQQRTFEKESGPLKLAIFNQLEEIKHARIVRNLCILRMSIIRNFKSINIIMRNEYKGIMSIPEYIPTDAINQLASDGIILKSNYRLSHYILDINRLILDRINNCQSLFPNWLNWQYTRNIFIMPNGLMEAGTKEASDVYYTNKSFYPYNTYLNWPPSDQGNILYNDKKFVQLLYEWNDDEFTDYSKVTHVRNNTKNDICDFIEDSECIVMFVDCENSNPYRLCAVLRELETDLAGKLSKVVLLDDIHTTNTWSILEKYVDAPVERILIERLKQDKSLVDIRLTAEVCKEFYQNKTDSFLLVSSDSDYWGLISATPDAKFLVMLEKEKCGPDMKAALRSNWMHYCYLNDFYTGNLDDIIQGALLTETRNLLRQVVNFNAFDILNQVIKAARIDLSKEEQQLFYNKYLKKMHLFLDNEGNAIVELNS